MCRTPFPTFPSHGLTGGGTAGSLIDEFSQQMRFRSQGEGNTVRHATGPRRMYPFPPWRGKGGMGGDVHYEAMPVLTPTLTLPRQGGGNPTEGSRQDVCRTALREGRTGVKPQAEVVMKGP
jgi:hypothetical protein